MTLEKIRGKATRCAVSFELNNVDLTGLTQATLVLTVDPSQSVSGWGNGETVGVQPLNAAWTEGNGKNFGLRHGDPGTGTGATWFSPVDEDISNDYANSTTQWDGGELANRPRTAPPATVNNHYSGELVFDVTMDVLNGADNGWLVVKDKENKGSKVSFYSREGAVAAGNPEFAPRLLLEFGEQTAQTGNMRSLFAGIRSYDHFQKPADFTFVGEAMLKVFVGPVLSGITSNVFRTWLS